MKICVLIPALNEAKTIASLVSGLRKRSLEVLVIDDGSTDESGELARQQGALVIRHGTRQGKGQSLRDGFAYATQNGFDAVLMMDGDGQHALEDIDAFLSAAQKYPNSIIAGTRLENPEGMPKLRFWTNRLMSGLISLACGQKIPDTQCGYRLVSVNVLEQIQLATSDYEIETEILMKAARKGFRIHSIPIKTIYQDEVSKINPLKDTLRFIKFFLRQLLSRN